jgi:hypothetical protein
MLVYCSAILGLDGKACKVEFERLLGSAMDRDGRPWDKARVFHGFAIPTRSIVDAKSLFLDRRCTIPVLAVAIH